LFTADTTKPFRLRGAGAEGLRFSVVTLWEVMEHIAEGDLPAVFGNIDAHLAPGGLVILSVSPNPEGDRWGDAAPDGAAAAVVGGFFPLDRVGRPP
jgi:hypothetical protein